MTSARRKLSDIGPVDNDTPLRLDVAAAKAFPDGTMTAAGLRSGRRAGLVVFRLAGKDYTTLQDIKNWITECRRKEALGCGSGQLEKDTRLSGSSSMAESRRAQDATEAILKGLKRPSKNTSGTPIGQKQQADVISLKSRSLT